MLRQSYRKSLWRNALLVKSEEKVFYFTKKRTTLQEFLKDFNFSL